MFSAVLDLFLSPWIFVLTVFLLLLTYDYYRRVGLPPGPYGLPFLGYIFSIDFLSFSQQCNKLCRKYNTDLITVPFPVINIIYINSYDLMKECYQKRTDLGDRDDYPLWRAFDENYSGIINTSGAHWREIRRFSISTLKDFGMGRVGAEERIQNESFHMIESINANNSQPFDPRDQMNAAVSNVICGMVFGQRFEYDDQKFREALAGLNGLFGKMTNMALIIALRSKFMRESFLFRKDYEECLENYLKFHNFVLAGIKDHKETYTGEVTDFIYGYLREMENGREFFTEKTLESLITDFFVAGSETTSTTMCWSILAMAAYPDIQNKVYTELNDVIGERRVSMADKKNTHYTEAVICEIQRHFTLAQFGLPHSSLHDDVTIDGCKIPKNTQIFANLHGIHHDPIYWKNPNRFDPNNFLENGKFVPSEYLVAFGIGRRSCAGQALAEMELYIFFSSLIKEFEIKLESDDTVPNLEGKIAAVFSPGPFKTRMVPRN